MNRSLSTTTLGCVGMTHLGLVYATAFAEKGFKVIAYDSDETTIANLQKQQLPIEEPQLYKLITTNQTHLHFTKELTQLKQCDLVFITCDVPTDEKGNSDLTPIYHFLNKIIPLLSNDASLVILSQVPPGFTRALSFPTERLFYQVETLIFGNAVERALYPERYIIGTRDPTINLPEAYLNLLQTFNCPILKMRYESAELSKIAINLFLISSITTTNLLAEVCEHIAADWEEVVPALRLDKRIGAHAYLTAGLGIAGGNLERDLNTIIKLGQAHTTEVGPAKAWLSDSQYRCNWVLRCIQKQRLTWENTLICILGLTYKANTHSLKNSASVALIKELQAQYLRNLGSKPTVRAPHFQINVHDPVAIHSYPAQIQDKGQANHSLSFDASSDVTTAVLDVFQFQHCKEAIQSADLVVIMTPWEQYFNLTVDELNKLMRGRIIIDPYRVLNLKSADLSRFEFSYFSLGQKAITTNKKQLTTPIPYRRIFFDYLRQKPFTPRLYMLINGQRRITFNKK